MFASGQLKPNTPGNINFGYSPIHKFNITKEIKLNRIFEESSGISSDMGSSRFNVGDTIMSQDDIKHYKTIKKNVMRGNSMIEYPTVES